jgi:GT2 family glycosyltransferase
VTEPLVTISVLVYGPSPWLRDVIGAVRANTTAPYELVVVDNGTTDDTRAYLATLDDARVLRPGHNLGFGGGHDLVANVARGEYLCLLNSDALVPAGWLPALLAPLAVDPTVGATAPTYVYPDGRLQEAGATVEPSGQVIAFGRFDDAGKPEYRLAGRVPFASAACLVTRLATFRAVGGFDLAYGVAYYEDVDFAFELREHGLHVELVAGVAVVHAQGASSETPADAERRLFANRERFRSRFASQLAGRPFVYARPEAHHLAAARDFDACDRVLVVADTLAAPGNAQPVARFVERCRTRLRDGRVAVIATGDRDAWAPAGVEVVAPADATAWCTSRRFHYAAVVIASSNLYDAAMQACLASTQPQAQVAVGVPAAAVVDDQDAFDRWLVSIDLVPRLVSMGAPE